MGNIFTDSIEDLFAPTGGQSVNVIPNNNAGIVAMDTGGADWGSWFQNIVSSGVNAKLANDAAKIAAQTTVQNGVVSTDGQPTAMPAWVKNAAIGIGGLFALLIVYKVAVK